MTIIEVEEIYLYVSVCTYSHLFIYYLFRITHFMGRTYSHIYMHSFTHSNLNICNIYIFVQSEKKEEKQQMRYITKRKKRWKEQNEKRAIF